MKVHGIIMWPIPNFMNVIYLTTCVVRKENVKWIFQIIMNSILSLFYQMLLICQKLLWRKLLGTYLQGNNNWALESDLARKHINGKNMKYLKIAMVTLIFNIFVCCKWLTTNHKQVFWLSCNPFWCVILRMKNAICNMFNDSLLISCKLFCQSPNNNLSTETKQQNGLFQGAVSYHLVLYRKSTSMGKDTDTLSQLLSQLSET